MSNSIAVCIIILLPGRILLFRYPDHDNNKIRGAFDFKLYLKYKNIYNIEYIAVIRSFAPFYYIIDNVRKVHDIFENSK